MSTPAIPVTPLPVPEIVVPPLDDQLAELPEIPEFTNPKSDRYRKGIPPVFQESQEKYMQGELTKLERVLDLAYDDVVKVNEDGTTLRAAIEREQIVRVTKDYALAKTIEKLTASVKTDREQTAATINNIQLVFADKDTAIAQTVQNLKAEMTTADASLSAAITNEQTARVTRDEALAQTITTLETKVNTATAQLNAKITDERTAWTTKTDSLAQTITTLEAKVNTNDTSVRAYIASERTAWASADTALGQRIDTVNTSIGNNSTAISNEVTARTNADSALGSRIDSITTRVGNNEAAISSEATARANGDSANASSISSLSTRVGNAETTVSSFSSSINGISAKWGVTINNNRRVSGLSLNSGADGITTFDLEAHNFNIWNPSTGQKVLYWNGTDLVVKGDITANKVTANVFNDLGANSLPRPVVGKPNIVAQGTYYESLPVGQTFGARAIVHIPTGVSAGSDWTTASTDQYVATCTISGGTSQNGGITGVGVATVAIGDGIGNGNSLGSYTNNQIYIIYEFLGWGNGSFTATSFNWKLARI